MVKEVKVDKVYAFDNQGDFEDLFHTYIRRTKIGSTTKRRRAYQCSRKVLKKRRLKLLFSLQNTACFTLA